MSKAWVQVRLTVETHARLNEYIGTLHRKRKLGLSVFPWYKPGPGRRRFSADDAVSALLDQVDDHRARAAKAGSRKKKGKAGEEEIIDVVPETPLELFRQQWAIAADEGMFDSLDSAEYKRVLAEWNKADQPERVYEWLEMMAREVLDAKQA